MADEDDALRVERIPLHQLVDELDAGDSIVACTRPDPVDVAVAAVLDVPARDPGGRERLAHVAGVDQVVDRLPVAAVKYDGEGQEPVVVRWQPQVSELFRLGPVGDPLVGGGRRRIAEDFLAVPQRYQTPGTSLAVSRA
jgi:hypothetical protein